MARTVEAGAKRDKMIPGIKATQQELDEINARAKSVGMNRSEYIRAMLFERAPKHKPKKLQLVDDRVVAELARQGGNLRDAKENGIVLAEFEQDFRHVAMKRFKKLSNEYMSSGEGDQWFGWGTYLALGDERGDPIIDFYYREFLYAMRNINGNHFVIPVEKPLVIKIKDGTTFTFMPVDKTGRKLKSAEKWEVDAYYFASSAVRDLAAAIRNANYLLEKSKKELATKKAKQASGVNVSAKTIEALEKRIENRQKVVDFLKSIESVSVKDDGVSEYTEPVVLSVEGPENDMLLHWEMPIDLNDDRISDIFEYIYDQIARLVESGDAQKAAEIANNIKEYRLFEDGSDATGRNLYYFLSEHSKALQLEQFDEERYKGKGKENDRLASLFLNYMGYDGHIFWANGNRNGESERNVYNAVIYDPENTLTITHRNGVPEVQEFEQDATVGQAPTTPIWRKALNTTKRKFGVKVDKVLNRAINGGTQISVMQTPLVFRLLGEKLRPVTMRAQKILDIKRDHPNITDDMIKDIPEQLANPIAILDSSPKSTRPKGSYVIITDYNVNGKPVIIAFHTKQKNGEHIINRVASIHDRKGGLAWVQSEIQAGRLRYWDTKRGPSAIYQTGISGNTNGRTVLPVGGPANLVANNIATDVDLDKARAQFNFEMYQGDRQSARGKTTFTPEETIISVFEGGDKSTMLHELGHVFLQELAQFAKMDGADPMFAEEWDIVAKWLKVEDLDPNDLKTEEEAKRWKNAQEQFAATFEAYLMEGNAPTPELQSVFRRFKQWLMDVYNSVRNIVWKDADGGLHHVEINDEIRSFFDRLFASRQAIEEQQAISRAEASVQTFAQALEKAGASAGSIENIRARARESRQRAEERLTADVLQEDTPEARADVAEVAAAQNIPDDRLARAVADIKNGELKLNIDEISENYGESMLDLLPSDIVAADGGLPISEVAAAYGYDTAEEFLNALASVRDDQAEVEADIRARQELDMIDESNIRDAADGAFDYEDLWALDMAAELDMPQDVRDAERRIARHRARSAHHGDRGETRID